MIDKVRVNDQRSGGCVDRVIEIHMGGRNSEYYTYSIDYECVYRVDGKWFAHEECDGQNGGLMEYELPSVTDSNVEAFAEERRAKWRA